MSTVLYWYITKKKKKKKCGRMAGIGVCKNAYNARCSHSTLTRLTASSCSRAREVRFVKSSGRLTFVIGVSIITLYITKTLYKSIKQNSNRRRASCYFFPRTSR